MPFISVVAEYPMIWFEDVSRCFTVSYFRARLFWSSGKEAWPAEHYLFNAKSQETTDSGAFAGCARAYPREAATGTIWALKWEFATALHHLPVPNHPQAQAKKKASPGVTIYCNYVRLTWCSLVAWGVFFTWNSKAFLTPFWPGPQTSYCKGFIGTRFRNTVHPANQAKKSQDKLGSKWQKTLVRQGERDLW